MTQFSCSRIFRCCTLFLLLAIQLPLFSQDYKKAWEAIANNDYTAAREHLAQAQKNTSTAADAALTQMLVESLEGRSEKEQALVEKASKTLTDPYPYYFALWSNAGVTGGYGLNEKEQKDLLESLVKDPKSPEMLKASARYKLMHYYNAAGEFKKAQSITLPISNITEWQFTGPFDNVSNSGFDKNYPPIEKAKAEDRFKATNQAEIRWFKPDYNNYDGWVLLGNHIKWSTGIVYAQSFVTAQADMDLSVAAGFTGSGLKIWVNDRLVLSELEERVTDFDIFSAPCQLKKGTNRILVQISLDDDDQANFCVRMLDKKGILAEGLTSSAAYAAYPKVTGPLPAMAPFFAETYFQQKIKADPDNPINYYLLVETYLRSRKCQEALEIVQKMLDKTPNSLLFKLQRFQCYRKLRNRTALTQEKEDIKQLVPDQLVTQIFLYEEAIENEKLDEAQTYIERWEKISGVKSSTYEKRIKLLLQRKKIQEAIQLIDEAYKEYPTEPYFASLQHDVELKINKNPDGATEVYSDFLKKNYYIRIAFALAQEYIQLGKGSKAVEIYEKIDEMYPEDADGAVQLFNYYYNIKDTKKARLWIDKLLNLFPFNGEYWESAAKLAERDEDKKAALSNFQKALHYSPNDYDVRRQIRELEGKPDFATLLPQNDPYSLYKNAQSGDKEGEYNWYYLLDEHCAILYPERNSEIYSTMVVKVLNEAGIDYWKEASIGYNDNQQRLIIEKAEILKPNGSKISAEQNGNQLVFPNLQVGDGVHIRYRLVNYAYGRMAREFFATWYFNSYVPADISRYSLYVPSNVNLNFKNVNMDMEPAFKELKAENLKQYTWEVRNEPAIKDQRFMPSTSDVGKILQVSSLGSWSDISTWYDDLSGTQAKRDYDVQQLAKKLFPPGKTYSQTEKAKTIYSWITKNIRYSSVPFRQSGFVPQRASRVIQTNLGDCKDLATLYAALAREVGLKANLVLVNTRDQGERAMELPSTEFNHCIVKVEADGQNWYLELTDPELPFGSLPDNDLQAFVLEIPFGANDKVNKNPFLLNPENRVIEYNREKSTIEIKGRELIVETDASRGGYNASKLRSRYKDEAQTKRLENMQNSLAKMFTNPLVVKELRFDDFSKPCDTLHYLVKYTVKNEVMEIGALNTFKVPFFNVFMKADAFPEEERVHPIAYWNYEDTDHYREEIMIKIPAGKNFSEVPTDVQLTYGKMKYNLKYTQVSPGNLKVVREIFTSRDNIPASEYEKFRVFTEGVVAAESRWIAFK